jgi:hypothetical protein
MGGFVRLHHVDLRLLGPHSQERTDALPGGGVLAFRAPTRKERDAVFRALEAKEFPITATYGDLVLACVMPVGGNHARDLADHLFAYPSDAIHIGDALMRIMPHRRSATRRRAIEIALKHLEAMPKGSPRVAALVGAIAALLRPT